MLSFLYDPNFTTIHDSWKNHTFDYMDLCWQKVMCLLFNMLSMFVIVFLLESKHLLTSWLQSPTVVILEHKKIKLVTASTFFLSVFHEVMGPGAMILVF